MDSSPIFQSTLPRRERRVSTGVQSRETQFQSTLPRRERQFQTQIGKCKCHFNPRSREGSDYDSTREKIYFIDISIHAPAKGATTFPLRWECRYTRFQSTLPRRERPMRSGRCHLLLTYFNPRSREGSDDDPKAPTTMQQAISIHAPAKGATQTKKNMQHTEKFQSTLPRRERHG